MNRIWTATVFAGLFVCLDLRRYQYLVAPEWRPLFLLVLTWLLALFFALFCWLAARKPGRPQAGADRWLQLGSGALACLLLLALGHQVSGSPLYSTALLGLLGAGCLAVITLGSWPAGSRFLPLLTLFLAVTAMVLLVRTTPFEEIGGDMLPLVRQGAQRFLSGESPYQDLRSAESGVLAYSTRPMPYPPLMWLFFLPLEVVGIDLRWLSVLSVLAVGLLWLRVGGGANEASERGFKAFLTVALFLSPTYLLRAVTVQTTIYWLLLALVAFALIHRARPLMVGLLLGLALGARESTLILLPLPALAYLRLGVANFFRFAVGVGTVSAAVYLPFLLADPAAFVSSLTYNAVYITALERPLTHIGFGPWLANLLGSRAPNVLQALVCVGLYLFSLSRANNPRQILLLLGTTYFLFMLFNPLVHEYYYYPGLLLLAFGLIPSPRLSAPLATTTSSQPSSISPRASPPARQ